jgi:hypothetical protein
MNNTSANSRPWVGGVIMIAIGLALLAAQLFEPAAWMVLGALAVVFLALFAGTRAYGFLVPGAILGGLAFGVGLEEGGYSLDRSAVLLGLASAFLAIYVVNVFMARPAAWWPLIPGGVLAMIGGSLFVGGTGAAEDVARWWPVVLIAVGVLVLLGGTRQRQRSNTPSR